MTLLGWAYREDLSTLCFLLTFWPRTKDIMNIKSLKKEGLACDSPWVEVTMRLCGELDVWTFALLPRT